MKPETNTYEIYPVILDAFKHKFVKLYFVVFGLFGLQAVSAQDVIVRKNELEIKAKVVEVGPEQVKYKRFDNPDGPIYIENRDQIQKISYANGTEDIFEANANISSRETVFHQVARQEKRTSKIRYSGLIELAPYFGMNFAGNSDEYGDYSGVAFSTAHGIQLSEKYFFGLGFGVNSGNDLYMPIFAAFRMNLSQEAAHPFLGASIGVQFDNNTYYRYTEDGYMHHDSRTSSGLWANIIVGYRFKNKFYVMSGIVIQSISRNDYIGESYSRIGFTIGIGVKF